MRLRFVDNHRETAAVDRDATPNVSAAIGTELLGINEKENSP
jgi:hypothetical protein